AIEICQQALGVFFDGHAPQAHGDHAEVRIEGIGRDRHYFFAPAILVDRLSTVVFGGEHFAVDAFRRDKHQRDVQRAFARDDVFSGDGISVSFDGGGEGAAGFVAVSGDAAEGLERKFRVDDHQLVVTQENYCVGGFSAGEAILHGEL